MQLSIQTNPESIKEGRGNFSKHFLSKNIFFENNLFTVAVICGSSVLHESSAECEKESDDSGRMGLLTTIHISLTFQTGSAMKISITASPLSSLWNFRIHM